MKIFSQSIAGDYEWKPCIECGTAFECGEILTSITSGSGCNVTYWYCSRCFEKIWPTNINPGQQYGLYTQSLPNNDGGLLVMIKTDGTLPFYIDEKYIRHRMDRFLGLEKSNNCERYIPYTNVKFCSPN